MTSAIISPRSSMLIPPEIVKRGPQAVSAYIRALTHGKRRIPRCNLLILGEQRVGKTSVYRLLVLRGFDPNQDSTRGIDNVTVNIVDRRNITAAVEWSEKDEKTAEELSDEQFVQCVVGILSTDLPTENSSESEEPTLTDSQLFEEISKLEPLIRQIVTTNPSTKAQDSRPPMTQPESLSQLAQPEAERTAPVPERQAPNDAARSQPTDLSLPSPPTKTSPNESDLQPAESTGKLSNRQARLLDEQLAAAAPMENMELDLSMTVFDFAGQDEYRPMHHCFLLKRAIYLAVINLRQVLRYLRQKSSSNVKMANPFEQLRYWLHSIHAHTLPDIPGKEEELMKNVCIVGTHLHPPGMDLIPDAELDEIHDCIEEEICSDERCVDHLHFVGPPGQKRIFAAVECSIDGEELSQREESGAKALQEELKEIALNLPFLKEVYPVSWLRMESLLLRLRENLKRNNSSLVTHVQNLQKLSKQCGILSPEDQTLALEFFHDSGKIIYLKCLPILFISKTEHEELAQFVILDPAWMITAMQYVIEVNYRLEIPLPNNLIIHLRKTGVAAIDLLRICWRVYLREPIEQSLRQFCLMLQSQGLIYPLTSDLMLHVGSESNVCLERPPSQTTSETSTATSEVAENYLIPCKLPKINSELSSDGSNWNTFYFDFMKFLPEEIFHRLICLMLVESKKKRASRRDPGAYLSRYCCRFNKINGFDWKIEMEREDHRLKVSVISQATDNTQHIEYIHRHFLLRICQGSSLEGLEYYGGPLVTCECNKTEVVPHVGYANGKILNSSSYCSKCGKKHNIQQLLSKKSTHEPAFPDMEDQTATQDEQNTENKLSGVPSGGHDPKTSDSQKQPTVVDRPQTEDKVKGHAKSFPTPNLQNLTIMKWTNEQGKPQKCRVIHTIQHKWKEMGRLLGRKVGELESIAMKYREDPEACCVNLVGKWLEDGSPNYPVSWDGLLELLDDMDFGNLVEELKKPLAKPCKTSPNDMFEEKNSNVTQEETNKNSTSCGPSRQGLKTNDPQKQTTTMEQPAAAADDKVKDHSRAMKLTSPGESAHGPPPPTVSKAFKVLIPLASEWQNIGMLLEIPDGTLKTVKEDCNKTTDCLREMLTCWLTMTTPRPTWEALAEAVETFDPNKAEDIKQKYCT